MSGWRRGGLAAVAVLAAAIVLSACAGATSSDPPTQAGGTAARAGTASAAKPADADVTVSVTRAPVTRPIADDFLGLAVEYNTIPLWSGTRRDVDRPLVGLVRGLQPTGRPLLRIGGQSTDRSWWPVRGLPQPRGVTYTLTRSWLANAEAMAGSLDARLMLGLNLEANRTRIPLQEAQRFAGGLRARDIASFQLGNEPELYHFTPWYRVSGGHPIPWYAKTGTPVYSRPAGYSVDDFMAEFRRFTAPLPRSVSLSGPETGNPDWMQTFQSLVSPHSRVRLLTAHGYGTSGCARNPSDARFPTIPHLLSLTASRMLLAGLTSAVAAAHRSGASFRLDEMGSVTCNGRAGVSDTMASALWAMDALFSLARQGVDGVNLHTYPGSVNGLFDIARTHGRWTATVHPVYYGALMFARAAPAGSRLVSIRVGGDQEEIRGWATLGSDRLVRVLVINDALSGSSRVRVQAPSGYGVHPATVQRLSAPRASATHAVTLGGRQFGATTTGVLPAPTTSSASPQAGAYTVTVPASSAALVVLAPS